MAHKQSRCQRLLAALPGEITDHFSGGGAALQTAAATHVRNTCISLHFSMRERRTSVIIVFNLKWNTLTALHFWALLQGAPRCIAMFHLHGLSALQRGFRQNWRRARSLKLSSGKVWMFDCGEGTQHQVSCFADFSKPPPVSFFCMHVFLCRVTIAHRCKELAVKHRQYRTWRLIV